GEEQSDFIDTHLPALQPTPFTQQAGYNFLQKTESTEVDGAFDVGWGAGTAGLILHVLPEDKPLRVFRSYAPRMTSSQTYPHLILRRQDASAATFRVVHEPFNGHPQLKTRLIAATPQLTAILVEAPGMRDWFLYKPEGTTPAKAVVDDQFVTISGRY